MKRLLVTGISSFLGKELAFFPQEDWEITGLYNNTEVHFFKIDCLKCDLTDFRKLEVLFNEIQADAVIHFAALSNPNYCEQNERESYQVNVEASIMLTKLCEKRNIPLVFTSTDLVFDGNNAPYSEHDETKPIMVYGKHKAKAEKEILKYHEKAIIARLPVIYGKGGFMKNWIEKLKGGEKIAAFTDEYRSMISAKTAIEGLFLLLAREEKGIWNLGGREHISRYDFALKMAKVFSLPKENIFPSLRKDIAMPADRPADVSMDSSKAYQIGFEPPGIEKSLKKVLLEF